MKSCCLTKTMGYINLVMICWWQWSLNPPIYPCIFHKRLLHVSWIQAPFPNGEDKRTNKQGSCSQYRDETVLVVYIFAKHHLPKYVNLFYLVVFFKNIEYWKTGLQNWSFQNLHSLKILLFCHDSWRGESHLRNELIMKWNKVK